MTVERLRVLIAAGETLDVEFKGESRAPLSDEALVENVVCLTNRPGDRLGWLLIGVEDDGTVTGARPRHEAGVTDLHRLQALIANRTRPSLSCRTYQVGLDEGLVLAIEVPPARSPAGTSSGLYVRRAIGGRGVPECRPFHFHEMQARQADSGLLDYSSLVVPDVTWEDLDPLEFERFRRFIRESAGRGDRALLDLPDLELAKALGAVQANHVATAVCVAGLLLFGREEALRRLLPTHEVAFQALAGTEVQVNDFFRWPLLRVMDEMLGRFRARHREEEILVGPVRVGVPDYPEAAVREAVANALIHRDYAQLGAVHVQLHSDRVEIANPGGFPEGVRLDNLLVTQPRPRNPLLADAFKRAGVVERTARGVDTIFAEQLRYGRPAPNYGHSNERGVSLVLPGGPADLAFARLVVEQDRADRPLGLDDLLLLDRLRREGELTAGAAALVIQRSPDEAHQSLQGLLAAGLVVARGSGTRRAWRLSVSAARRLGLPPGDAPQEGAGQLTAEGAVLQHVAEYGRITRREVAKLCQLSSDQAKRLLARLVGLGKLQPHGEGKARSYGAPPGNTGSPITDTGAPVRSKRRRPE